jgi:hypothetical protein
MDRNDKPHDLRFNAGWSRIATDNVASKQTSADYYPVPPTPSGYFLEFQGGGVPFLLLAGAGQYLNLL